MKEFLTRLLIIILIFSSAFVLGFAILLPFTFGDESFPNWIYFVIYPLALILVTAFPNIVNILDKFDN